MAEVLSADAFAAFEENGVFRQQDRAFVSSMRSWPGEEAAMRWKLSSTFEAANPMSARC